MLTSMSCAVTPRGCAETVPLDSQICHETTALRQLSTSLSKTAASKKTTACRRKVHSKECLIFFNGPTKDGLRKFAGFSAADEIENSIGSNQQDLFPNKNMQNSVPVCAMISELQSERAYTFAAVGECLVGF